MGVLNTHIIDLSLTYIMLPPAIVRVSSFEHVMHALQPEQQGGLRKNILHISTFCTAKIRQFQPISNSSLILIKDLCVKVTTQLHGPQSLIRRSLFKAHGTIQHAEACRTTWEPMKLKCFHRKQRLEPESQFLEFKSISQHLSFKSLEECLRSKIGAQWRYWLVPKEAHGATSQVRDLQGWGDQFPNQPNLKEHQTHIQVNFGSIGFLRLQRYIES